MQLTIFGDDANRAALSINGFVSKEPALLCPFQKKIRSSNRETVPRRHGSYNCIALSVYVCRTSTPRELEMFWRRQECHSEMIPQGLALHSSQLTSSQGKGSLSTCSNLRAPPPTATFYLPFIYLFLPLLYRWG